MTKPITKKEIREVVQGVHGEDIQIEHAPQEEVVDLSEEITTILKAIGFPTAWVSDESTLWDFWFSRDPDEVQKEEAALTETVGFEVSKDYLVDIARRMKGLPPRPEVWKFPKEVEILLAIVDRDDAVVTDQTTFRDFMDPGDPEGLARISRRCKTLEKRYEFLVDHDDTFLDVARKMRKFRNEHRAKSGRR